MTIAVDLHLMIFGLVLGLSLISLVVHLALRWGSALGWLAASLLSVSVELLVLRYGPPSTLTTATVAVLVPASYVCAAQAVRLVTGLPLTGRRVALVSAMLVALSLVLLISPLPPTLQYVPFQLAGIFIFLDTMLALARRPGRGTLEHGLLALGFLILAGVILRVPMFPTLLGQPAPWAPFDSELFERSFIQGMGVFNTSFAVVVVALIVTKVIVSYRHSSERDGLTDLLNRRAFDALVDEPATSRGAIVMCDIDRFKAINDRFGHHAGDEVIRSLARMLGAEGYPAGRIGGEEFALLLPDAGLEGAITLAERIRAAFAALRHPAIGPTAQLSASFGVAPYDAGMPIRAAMRSADKALYRAKQSGRNRVDVARDERCVPQRILSAA